MAGTTQRWAMIITLALATLSLGAGSAVALERPGAASRDLWATPEVSAFALGVVVVLASVGIVVAFRLLQPEGEPVAPGATPAEPPDGVSQELAAIARARRSLVSAVGGAEPRLRARLTATLEEPLRQCDRRVRELERSARTLGERTLAAEHRRLEDELVHGRALLEEEDDPRARALLEASLRDLQSSRASAERLGRERRLAILELQRLRTLLETLPGRVRELEARRAVEGCEHGDVEAIAGLLEGVIESHSEVVDDAATRLARS